MTFYVVVVNGSVIGGYTTIEDAAEACLAFNSGELARYGRAAIEKRQHV